MPIHVRLTSGSLVAQDSWSGSNTSVLFDGTTAVVIEVYATGALCTNNAAPTSLFTCTDGTTPGSGADSWGGGGGTPLAAGIVNWSLLNAPEGTEYNEAWFIANNGLATLNGINPLDSTSAGSSFIPDKEGTWFFQVTRTDTSESTTFVVSTLSVKTGLRIPAAGETNQADQDIMNRSYPNTYAPGSDGSPNNQGWGKDRNAAFSRLNSLVTSGGLQLCYFDDPGTTGAAPWSGYLKAGAAVSISGVQPLPPGGAGGENVPKVKFAQGDDATRSAFAGIVYGGFKPTAPTPSSPKTSSMEITKTEIPNPGWVLVSRAGIVESASGVIDTTGLQVGQALFVSPTNGLLQQGCDYFALASVDRIPYTIPAAIVLEVSATNARVLALPSKEQAGESTGAKDQTLNFRGLGDFKGLRVGHPYTPSVGVANELTGAIEAMAKATEDMLSGDVVILTYDAAANQMTATKGNSYNTATAAEFSGTVGVAVESVSLNDIGHFVIYGPATITLSPTAAATSSPTLYLGPSRQASPPIEGVGVLYSEISGNITSDLIKSWVVPIGKKVAGQSIVMVGMHETDGVLYNYFSGIVQGYNIEWGGYPGDLRSASTHNKQSIQVHDGVFDLSENINTNLKVAGSGADDPLVEIDLYESKLPGSAFWDLGAAGTALAGTRDATYIYDGAPLQPSEANRIYGSFNFDNRLMWGESTAATPAPGALTSDSFNFTNEIYLKVWGYAPSDNTSYAVRSRIRFNVNSITDAGTELPTTEEPADYPYYNTFIQTPSAVVTNDHVGLASELREFQINIPLVDGTTFTSSSGQHRNSTAHPKLNLLTPAANKDTVGYDLSYLLSRYPKTVDILLERTDSGVGNFYVTQVSLFSKRRPVTAGYGGVPGRRSIFESSYPAYALTRSNGLLDIVNKAPDIVAAPGTAPGGETRYASTVGVIARGGISTFIPIDPRAGYNLTSLSSNQTLILTIRGKIKFGANVAGDTLGFTYYIKEVEYGQDYTSIINTSTPQVNGAVTSQTPTSSTAAGTVTVFEDSVEIPAPSPSTNNVLGYWVQIDRSVAGTNTLDIGGTEVFCVFTNIQLRSKYPNEHIAQTKLLEVPENIYECPIYPTSIVSDSLNTFNPYSVSDVVGFKLEKISSANSNCTFNAILDERYDDKSGLVVEVLSTTATSGSTVDYSLYVQTDNLGADLASTNRYLGKISFVNTAAIAAGNSRWMRHRFTIPANELWGVNNALGGGANASFTNPSMTWGGARGFLRFKLMRVDDNPYDVGIAGVLVRGKKSNKTKWSAIRSLNTLEQQARSRTIASFTQTDVFRAKELSIQRYQYTFTAAKEYAEGTTALTAGSSAWLSPPWMASWSLTNGGISAGSANTPIYGYEIPYSMAITNVTGWTIGRANATATPGAPIPLNTAAEGEPAVPAHTNSIALDFFIMEVPQKTSEATNNLGSNNPATHGVQSSILGVGHSGANGIDNCIISPGVQGFPLTLYPKKGDLRWDAGASILGALDRTTLTGVEGAMPQVLLPELYYTLAPGKDAGYKWQLCCQVRNTGTNSVYPIINLQVEVALIPNPTPSQGYMGGSSTNMAGQDKS